MQILIVDNLDAKLFCSVLGHTFRIWKIYCGAVTCRHPGVAVVGINKIEIMEVVAVGLALTRRTQEIYSLLLHQLLTSIAKVGQQIVIEQPDSLSTHFANCFVVGIELRGPNSGADAVLFCNRHRMPNSLGRLFSQKLIRRFAALSLVHVLDVAHNKRAFLKLGVHVVAVDAHLGSRLILPVKRNRVLAWPGI